MMNILSKNRQISGSVISAPMILAGVIIFIFCMAILVIFRQHCVEEGYDISKLSSELEKKSLIYEAVSQKYSDALRWEILYKKAEQMEFTFPVGGNVYYVQQ